MAPTRKQVSDPTRLPLWQVSITTSSEAEEAVSELLARVTGQTTSSFHDFKRHSLTVAASFLTWPEPRKSLLKRLDAGFETLRKCGLNPAPARICVRRLPSVDWAESWKEHFPDLEIGNALLIRPGWSRRQPNADQLSIELDPGLSFGTGHHPTTRFCLEELVRRRPPATPASPLSMLDIGTGSGLLAIAAAKLGYQPVHAFDFDPLAIRVAKENAKINRVDKLIRFRCADLRQTTELLQPHSVTCANLQLDLLLDHARTVAAAVTPGGSLILAGTTRRERKQLLAAYATLGFRRERTQTQGEWASVALRLPA